MRFTALFVTGLFLGGLGVVSAQAQSLAEAAKKEEQRRKNVPTPGKVYTNKDLKPVPDASPTPDAAPDGQPAGASGTLSVAGPSAGTKPADGKTAPATPVDAKGKVQESKGEAYWRARMLALRENLDRNKTLLAALESRLNGLKNDFVNRDDPAQRNVLAREHEKALAELERVRKAVDAGPVEIAEAEEEARQAGVPPGWLR